MSRLTDRLHEQSKIIGISQAAIARELNVTPQAINNLFNGRAASSEYWREIASMLQISESEMRSLMIEAGRDPLKSTKLPRIDLVAHMERERSAKEADGDFADRDAERKNAVKPMAMIPYLGQVAGGDDGEFLMNGKAIDYTERPPVLASVPDAYAVYVSGESMVPRYRPSETVFVHPGRPPRRGDDVVVQVRGRGDDGVPLGYIKEYVAQTGSKLILRQYNPEKQIEIPIDDVVSVHLIVQSGKYN